MKNAVTLLVLCLLTLVRIGTANASSPSIDLNGSWKFQTDSTDIGLQKGWQLSGYDDKSWRSLNAPGNWEGQGITQVNPKWQQMDDLNQPYTGYAWYRKTVNIPADWKGKNVVLNMGRVDDLDWTYLNGIEIGKNTDRNKASSSVLRVYHIPAKLVKCGQPNVIVVRVLDLRGLGGIVEGPLSIALQGSAASSGPGRGIEKVGGNVEIESGQTVVDVNAVMGNVTIRGHVTGDVAAVMGDVTVCPEGRVDGNINVVGGTVNKEPGSFVGGNVSTVGLGGSERFWRIIGGFPFEGPIIILVFAGALLLHALLAAAIVALFPARMQMIADTSVERPWWSLLYGLIGWALIVPVTILLVLTCIGIPFVFFEFVLVFCAWVAGATGIKLAVGRKIGVALNRPIESAVLAAVIGSVLLSLLKAIPFVGVAVVLVLVTLGFGAVIMTGFGAGPDWFTQRLNKGSATPASPAAGE